MYDYIEPYKTCDDILNLFSAEKSQGLDHADIQSRLGFSNHNQGYVANAITKLISDGRLLQYGADDRYFKLGGDTLIFKDNGGYKEDLKNQKRNYELKELLDQTTLKVSDSVIKTNDLVQANTKKQENLTRAALYIAGFSAIVSLAGLAKEYVLKSDKSQTIKLPTRDSIFQKTSQRIDTLTQTLYRIDYSIKALNDSLKKTYKNIK